MDQIGRLQRVVPPLAREPVPGDGPQFIVDQVEEPVPGVMIAASGGLQDG